MADRVDVLVMGAGFGGTLLSLMLKQRGMNVALVDAGSHPRFAIGESSTPVASQTLRWIVSEYQLPELLPLASWGRWKTEIPHIGCGRKRGFTYVAADSEVRPDGVSEMLVAASGRDEVADTHWLRSDVDFWLFELARASGVRTYERTQVYAQNTQRGWNLVAENPDFKFKRADFVVDATGGAQVLLRQLAIPASTESFKTQSRAVFGHFKGVRPLTELFSDKDQQRYPFDCDAAAVHLVMQDRWMWQLRFDDDTVSCGIVGPLNGADCKAVWNTALQKSDLLQAQFCSSKCIRPSSGLQMTGPLQRLTTRAAGTRWAALPATAGFIDPLHSTGIAHTLFGVRRLANLLTAGDGHSRLLQAYSDRVIAEIRHIDRLVAGCYRALPSFHLWCTWSMLYFAAATSAERDSAPDDFLHAADPEFQLLLDRAEVQLDAAVASASSDGAREFREQLRQLLEPWNSVGLLDAHQHPYYWKTAAPEET